MSYRVEQKIGNHTYVYEVESYWDSFKKQPRQKRRYLGKKNPETGEIYLPQRGFTPRAARDFGHVYLVTQIIERIGLPAVIKKIFPELFWELLYLSLYQVLESKPLYLFRPWAEATYLKEPLYLSSQRTSQIIETLGQREDLRNKFYKSWVKSQGDIQTVIFDITSFSSYSRLVDYLEWGYNRDGEKLPQLNLGLICGQPSQLPLAYRIYPGSIADVSTLKNIIILLDELQVRDFTFILDKGFYSATNICDMGQEGIGFVLPLSFRTKVASQLISANLKELLSPLQGFYYKGRPLFHLQQEISISGVPLKAHLYHDEKRKADEVEHLMRRITEIEEKVLSKEFWSIKAVGEYLNQAGKGYAKLFEITGKAPHFRLNRKAKAISRLFNRMGKTILLTNDFKLGREELLNLYRRKDTLEKMFNIIKNELEGRRLRVSSREAVEGRIFLTFLSLIIYSELSRIMKDKGLYKNYTLQEVLCELKKLRVVELNNDRTYLTEVTKKQRNLFEKFDVPIPVKT